MRPALLVTGGLLSAAVAYWAATGDQTGRIGSHLLAYGIAFAAYLFALARFATPSPSEWRFALGLAVAWRVALALGPPLLSDDVNRYVWEGRIQLHGGNPYRWQDRPEAAHWAPLRDELWKGVNHKDYTAIYPPLWQLAARAVVAVHDSILAMKLFLVGCELVALDLLRRLLAARGAPRERLLVWAWSPLALVEISGSGHNEAFGLLFFLFALLLLELKRPLLAALAAVLGFHAKLVPGLLALASWRRFHWLHAVAGAVLAAALIWPYASAGPGLVRSALGYAEFWRFNETLLAVLATFLAPATAAKVALVLIAHVALVTGEARVDPVHGSLITAVAFLALCPSVLPWYALWLLPLVALRDSPGSLLFTGTVGLAYLVYPEWLAGGTWQVGWGVRALEYLPCVAVAAEAWWRRQGLAE